jgi:hypothetical protein
MGNLNTFIIIVRWLPCLFVQIFVVMAIVSTWTVDVIQIEA